jgi:acyl-coenzyme A synthetase/AMP-(fatty) acid ligase
MPRRTCRSRQATSVALTRHEDGYLRFFDRKSDPIRCHGRLFSTFRVEDVSTNILPCGRHAS